MVITLRDSIVGSFGIEGVGGDNFGVIELRIETQRVSKFLFKGSWKSLDTLTDFLFTWISICSQVTSHDS